MDIHTAAWSHVFLNILSATLYIIFLGLLPIWLGKRYNFQLLIFAKANLTFNGWTCINLWES